MQRQKKKAVKMLFLPLLTGNTTGLTGSRTVGEREAKLNWIPEQRAVIKRSILRSPQTSGSAVAPATGLLVRMPLGAAQRQSCSTEDPPGGSANDTCRIQTYHTMKLRAGSFAANASVWLISHFDPQTVQEIKTACHDILDKDKPQLGWYLSKNYIREKMCPAPPDQAHWKRILL